MFSFFGLIIVYATFYILMPSLMIICAKKQEANPVEVDVTLNSSRTSPMLSIATPVNSATTPTAKEPEKVRPTKSEPKPSPQQAASDAKTNRKKTAPSSAKKTQEESQDPDLYPEIKRLPSKPNHGYLCRTINGESDADTITDDNL
uniref:Uncharacterized protein n=1 Tax=Panagrolaimus sp. JU765 TaxID=591449 RepID=A0AC34QDF5_9BILA